MLGRKWRGTSTKFVKILLPLSLRPWPLIYLCTLSVSIHRTYLKTYLAYSLEGNAVIMNVKDANWQ